MSYCSVTDALALLGDVTLRDASTGVAASTPSLTQAQALVAQVTAEIDMHLRGCGYALPITDSEALASLQAIAMNGVAARIAKAKWPTDAGPGGEGGVAHALRDDYRRGLAFIDGGGLAGDISSESASGVVAYAFTRPYAVLMDTLDTTDDEAPF